MYFFFFLVGVTISSTNCMQEKIHLLHHFSILSFEFYYSLVLYNTGRIK